MQTLIQPTPLVRETVDDWVSQLLAAGTNVTLIYDDVGNTLTISATGGSSDWTRVDTAVGTLTTGLLAFWRMEETSGNRLDSVSAMALVPQGGATYGIGKHGNAAKLTGGAGTYFSIADNATLSIGAAQSFTIACWVCFDATPASHTCLVGKGNTAAAYDDAEYLLKMDATTLRFYVADSVGGVTVNSGFVPVVGEWFLAIGWLDAAANLLHIQINNNPPVSVVCTRDSYDSAFAMEIGRSPGWSGSPLMNGRIDNVMFYKRILTIEERTALWNGGLGLDYAELGSGITFLHPIITLDKVLAGSDTLTSTEPLESAQGIKIGNSSGTTNGIIRWTGTDLEVRKNGAWISLTYSEINLPPRFLLMGA